MNIPCGRILGAVLAGAFLAGCASEPVELALIPYDEANLADWTCNELARAEDQTQAKVTTLYYLLRENAHHDRKTAAIAGPTGLIFLRRGDAAEASEYRHQQGKLQAIRAVQRERSCFRAHDDVASAPPPRKAAATPQAAKAAGAAAPAAAPAQAGAGPAAYVQIGTFGVPSNARNTAGAFSRAGFDAEIRAAGVGGRSLERVLIGPLRDASEIEEALAAARAAGLRDAFVTDG